MEDKLLTSYRKYYMDEIEAALEFAEAEAATENIEDDSKK